METKPLSQRQIFGNKRASIEMTAINYYDESQDTASLIEYAVALLVRNAVAASDFSLIFYDLIRDLYLSSEKNETMRKFLPFFENYFSKKEWKRVVLNLFPSMAVYFQQSKKARDYYKLVTKPTSKKVSDIERKVKIVSVFEDENGKEHRWIMQDADPLREKEDFKRILEILTMLTIFQNNGTRKFAKLVTSKRVFSDDEELVAREPKPRKTKNKKTSPKKKRSNSVQKPSVQSKKTNDKPVSEASLPTDINPRFLSKKDYEELARAVIPKDADLKDYYFEVTDPETGEVSKIQLEDEKLTSDSETDSLESIRNKTKQSKGVSKAMGIPPEKEKNKPAALVSTSKEAEKPIAAGKEETSAQQSVKTRNKWFGFFSRNKIKDKNTIDY